MNCKIPGDKNLERFFDNLQHLLILEEFCRVFGIEVKAEAVVLAADIAIV
jgi:hypothetical protein